ncbi:TIM44-like domain-containing protein [Bacteriovorax sp. PP10]|uniref:TIM44-like domain-containing protein n=1 Tax=Bacteriovorax antarcticus TaxID=3088717 RepID=A0ABU5VQ83_9BACT|nr:TIM44-like domain-containing protein [Bacteriovorax sp. PP10]MEA9355203.1 TIM44-like domain-containing protein [Bacteriovorax sp. PP10]
MVLNAYMNYRIAKRTKKVQKALQRMKEHEPEWDEEKLIKFSKDRFMYIQNLKGMHKLEGLREVLAYKFYLGWEKEIEKQIKKSERYSFSELEILDAFIVDFKNYLNDNNDIFTVCFDAVANDQTLRKGKVVLENYSDFREFWTFRKQAGEWKLFEITQANGWEKFIDGKLVFEKLKKKHNTH